VIEQDHLTSIKVALARIEEQQKASLYTVNTVALNLAALNTKLDRYVEKEDLKQYETRIIALENSQLWMLRSSVGAAIALAMGAVYALGKKLGWPG
jgi:hypothetical protein